VTVTHDKNAVGLVETNVKGKPNLYPNRSPNAIP